MRMSRPVNFAGRIVLGIALIAGCASVPSTPLTDVRAIAGEWRGTITFGVGPAEFYHLTVNADATIVAAWGPNWQWGTLTLNGGQARFELSHLSSGTLLYFDGSDGRVITMTPDFGGWYVYVTPLK